MRTPSEIKKAHSGLAQFFNEFDAHTSRNSRRPWTITHAEIECVRVLRAATAPLTNEELAELMADYCIADEPMTHTPRVAFYGDASLPNYEHRGHFEYGPEVRGIPAYGAVEIPRELWGTSSKFNRTPRDREYYRRWDHAHLLPWVPVRSEHRVCRERSRGNKDHHWNCACSQGRTEGQAPGTAQLTHTANYTVLACWDYTGDMRGGCYSMFWIKGKLPANDMVAAIRRDFLCIWARITAGSGTMEVWGDDPPPAATVVDAVAEAVAPLTESVPGYDISIPDELFVKACAKTAPQLVQIMEESLPVANERLRRIGAKQ